MAHMGVMPEPALSSSGRSQGSAVRLKSPKGPSARISSPTCRLWCRWWETSPTSLIVACQHASCGLEERV
ncbi:hypothetical protein D3C79_844280 [compost metagenome]